jgi:LysM repeat protein
MSATPTHRSTGHHHKAHRKAHHRKAAKQRAHRRAHKRPARHVRIVVVRPGDTVSGIALRYHTTWAAVLKANGMRDARQLWAGQRLRVPVSGHARSSAHRPKAKRHHAKRHHGKRHHGKRHHQKHRQRAHGKKTHHRSRSRRTRVVTVRPGETLSGIALRAGTTWQVLARLNGITDPRQLWAGQRLRVPGGEASRSEHRSAPKHRKHERRHHKRSVRKKHNSFAGRTYPDAVVRSAAANRRWLARHPAPSRSQIRAMIVSSARRHGVDPKLALAVGYLESGWNQRMVSVANAIGTMQVIPSTGQWASQMAGRKLHLLRAQDNITAGVVVLRALTRSADNERQAIAGYYQGLAGVRQNGMYADTRQYVRNVLALKSRM